MNPEKFSLSYFLPSFRRIFDRSFREFILFLDHATKFGLYCCEITLEILVKIILREGISF